LSLAVISSSKAHAVTRIEMDLREGSPVSNQCREFGSGSRRDHAVVVHFFRTEPGAVREDRCAGTIGSIAASPLRIAPWFSDHEQSSPASFFRYPISFVSERARGFEISVNCPRLTRRFHLSREYYDDQHVSQ